MIEYTFNNGPTVSIINENYDTFLVKFYSNEQGVKKFTGKALVKNNTFYSLLREWYTNWYIEVYVFDIDTEQLKLYDTHQFDLKNKNVAIFLYPDNIEDEEIWLKECNKFKELHKCKLTIINAKKQPNIRPTGAYYATYNIGRFDIKENSIKKYGDFEQYHGKINEVYITYDSFKNPRNWEKLNSKQIIDDILCLPYSDTIEESTFSKQLDNFYSGLKQKTEINILNIKDTFNVNFVDGPFLEILGQSNNLYDVVFIDTDTNEIIYRNKITPNHWVKANRKWYTNWKISVFSNDELVFEHYFNCKGKRVYIALDSKSLGDTIAWFPYVEEFAKKNECKVICSTFWNEIFQSEYPNIEFVNPGTYVDNIYAMFVLGIFGDGYSNKDRNKRDTRKQPLQSVATDILGLEFKEIKPNISNPVIKINNNTKYVCISEHGSAQSKYWNNQRGWQEVVDYLVSIGYEVRVISKEPTNLKNIVDYTGDRPIAERIAMLKNASAFIGISSGLSWLAWAVGTKVIMISGHTDEWYEFKCYRISPPANVCHGCWHDYVFDKGNWNWCPVNEHTNRQFECTKQIESNVVIDAINNVLIGDELGVSNNKIISKTLKFSEFYINKVEKPIDLMLEGYQDELGMYDEIFNKKIYEYKNCKINKDDIVFDVGANIGIFTRYAANLGAYKIYSFEPEETNAKLFEKNKPDNCIFFNLGISDIEGRQKLNIDETIGGHSIIQTNSFGTKTGKTQFPLFTKLDNIIEQENITRIDFLKIDVEGAEFNVMKGLSDKNLNKVNKCVVEYHHNVFNYDDELKTKFIKRFILSGFTFHEEPINKHLQMLYFWK